MYLVHELAFQQCVLQTVLTVRWAQFICLFLDLVDTVFTIHEQSKPCVSQLGSKLSVNTNVTNCNLGPFLAPAKTEASPMDCYAPQPVYSEWAHSAETAPSTLAGGSGEPIQPPSSSARGSGESTQHPAVSAGVHGSPTSNSLCINIKLHLKLCKLWVSNNKAFKHIHTSYTAKISIKLSENVTIHLIHSNSSLYDRPDHGFMLFSILYLSLQHTTLNV